MSTEKLNSFDIVIEAVKFVALSAFLVFACFDAAYPDAFWKPAGIIFKGAIIGLAYFLGRHFANIHKEGWRNYLLVFYGVGILTITAWAGLGMHTEGGDALFGGGETVFDFVPTKVERANHALTIFLSLFIPAIYGMYKERNPY